MSPLERRRVLAEISKLSADTGVAGEHANVLRQQAADIPLARRLEESQYTTMNFPQDDGTVEKRQVKTADVQKMLATGASIADRQDQQEFQRRDKIAARERQNVEDSRKLEDDARNAEQDILGKDKSGSKIANQEVARVPIEEFNRKSSAPYIYSFDPANASTLSGTNTKKIELIDASGKRHMAKDVYKRAQLAIEQGIVSSVEEYVQKFLYKDKPLKFQYLK